MRTPYTIPSMGATETIAKNVSITIRILPVNRFSSQPMPSIFSPWAAVPVPGGQIDTFSRLAVYFSHEEKRSLTMSQTVTVKMWPLAKAIRKSPFR